MTGKTLTAILLSFCCISANAGDWKEHPAVHPNTKLRPDKTVLLYPEGQSVNKGITEEGIEITKGPGESNGLSGDERCNPVGNRSNIGDCARMDIYLPKKCNGQMVLICPGGSYSMLASFNEGVYPAEWLTSRGIAACVVKYRLPNHHPQVPLTDIQNAFRYCRFHAAEWGVTQIGVMGFSAGGHLAARASTMYEEKATRPDFSILIYPRITYFTDRKSNGKDNLIGPESQWYDKDRNIDEYSASIKEYSRLVDYHNPINHVSPDTPPTIIFLCANDTAVEPDNYADYYCKLLENEVPVAVQVFPDGGHGWGFSSERYAGAGKDRFKKHRKCFELMLESWLENL